MHLLVRDRVGLEEGEAAVDLGQSPADLVFLSFSDSDLGALAAAWEGMGEGRPGLRLANLARLKHPMSVDTYVEDVVARARCVVLRLLGGLEYWRYGAEEVGAVCRARGIALAVVPGDGRADARLDVLSTVKPELLRRMDALLGQGGAANMRRALDLAAFVAGLGPAPEATVETVPLFGEVALPGDEAADGPLAVVVFYRSYLLADDIAPVRALAAALRARGMRVRALHAASLKEPEGAAFVAGCLRDWRPAVVLSATGFSARGADGSSPLDAAGVPVLQLVLAGSGEAVWAESSRGLGASDLAMQVVLPELDGRLLTTAISFKEMLAEVPGLEFARVVHRPHAPGIALAADRAAGWARLAGTPRGERVLALVLSDYPGAGGQVGHAVGLDSFASAAAILRRLRAAGYDVEEAPADLARRLTEGPAPCVLDGAAYARMFAALPAGLRDAVTVAWGAPPAEGITLRHVRLGRAVVLVEPDRGSVLDRKAGYHDPDTPPCHAYVGFHLWRLHVLACHAVVHLGAHGALEWLPGKAAALGDSCWPAALIGPSPVVYPYIVNNPGEAAAAKRRLGAVTVGHLTPPLRRAGLAGPAAELERLIDEYAAADGLDRRRVALLRGAILDLARETGVLAESGVRAEASDDEALARLDAYLCDVKDMQIRDGLHVFGEAPDAARRGALLAALEGACPGVAPAALASRLDASAGAEAASLLAALDGRFVAPGPAGAPTRGRADVLPTGRNLTTADPRTMPTRLAMTLAEKTASALLRRHVQEHGDYPKSVVIDLWGSAAMRTGGEDLALALVLLGAKPEWDAGSNRVNGVEILPLALLDRPRVDVTLRVSGLFRDAFETQIALFDAAVRAVAGRDEAPDWNPLAGDAGARVFGAAPGAYGAGISDRLARGGFADRDELGAAYLDAGAAAYGQGRDGVPDRAGFAVRVAAAEAFVHAQDHAEIDLLEGFEHAAHEGGFAAAAALLGAAPALYHADTTRPEAPRVATVAEEVVRVVRGRAANPAWVAGQMRHGYRGAAEIAKALHGLYGFAATLPARFDAQFEALFAATLGDGQVDAFLASANPAARADMAMRFQDAVARGLWRPRRNDLGELTAEAGER